jgi:hypothetical protein
MSSYRVLWLCHRRLTPKYRQLVASVAASKRVHHVRSPAEMEVFLRCNQTRICKSVIYRRVAPGLGDV